MNDVLITGGGGRLARALSAAFGARANLQNRQALNIADRRACAHALEAHQPKLVVNAAAMANVDACEHDRDRAFAVNAQGAGAIASACADAGVPLIHISTDFVFGGDAGGPWRESDATAPINAYGESKLAGERAALEANGAVCIARVAWLFGDGQDFPTRLLDLAAKQGEAAAAADQIGSPTPMAALADHLATLGRRMMARQETPRVLHLAGSPPASRFDWAQEAWLGASEMDAAPAPLKAVRGDEFKAPARRPAYSALDSSLAASLLGSSIAWREAARDIGRRWAKQQQAPSLR